MLKPEKIKELLKRLNRISGQIEGIKKMVAQPRYCIDILTQISAVSSALQGVSKFVLEDHIKTCVKSAVRKGAGEREIKELMGIIGRYK